MTGTLMSDFVADQAERMKSHKECQCTNIPQRHPIQNFPFLDPKYRMLEKVANAADRASPCEGVVLWVDSTDFAISGKRSVRRRDPRWSQKLKNPGGKWMVMMDAATKAPFLASPNHPTRVVLHAGWTHDTANLTKERMDILMKWVDDVTGPEPNFHRTCVALDGLRSSISGSSIDHGSVSNSYKPFGNG
jgi:hypothetical protein